MWWALPVLCSGQVCESEYISFGGGDRQRGGQGPGSRIYFLFIFYCPVLTPVDVFFGDARLQVNVIQWREDGEQAACTMENEAFRKVKQLAKSRLQAGRLRCGM